MNNTVLLIELSSFAVTDTLSVGNKPQSIAITPDGRYAFVGNEGSHTVSVIDIVAFTVVQAITVGSGSKSIAVAPDGRSVIVSNASIVSIIDVETLSVVQTTQVYSVSAPIIPAPAASPDGSRLYLVGETESISTPFSAMVLKNQAM